MTLAVYIAVHVSFTSLISGVKLKLYDALIGNASLCFWGIGEST